MASSVRDTRHGRKRSAESVPQKRKKMKNEQSEDDASDRDSSDMIQSLERQILDSRQYYNNINLLLHEVQSSNTAIRVKAVYALCRVFCHLLASGDLKESPGSTQREFIVIQWLSIHLGVLWQLVKDSRKCVLTEDSAPLLRLLMQLLREESLSGNSSPTELLEGRAKWLFEHVALAGYEKLHIIFMSDYATRHLDVAYGLALEIKQGAAEDIDDHFVDSAIKILKDLGNARPGSMWMLPMQGRASNDAGPIVTQKMLTRAVGKAWLAVLTCDMEKHQRKTVLKLIPNKIVPLLSKPEKLLDFLVDSFDGGGSTALLALSGLFRLIEEKNLDYPHFYSKVYSMLDGSILHSKYRSTFLRLLDRFLASSHLPAVLVASFVKRLARLCLFAPPAAIAYIVPLTYNLLKAHPMCTFMIHRPPTGEEDDPFDMDEKDPMETGALESSLWELHTLHSHYHPNVSVIARIISEQFTKPAYNLEDFLDHSYSSMLEADLTKPIKKEPAIEYQIPKVVFPRQQREETVDDDVLGLWCFDA